MRLPAYPNYKPSLSAESSEKAGGVEWLGDVPEHWEVKRIKHLGSIRYGLGEPPEYVDDGLPFVRATDIKRGKINLDEVKKVRPEDAPWSRKPLLNFEEILVVRSGAYTGDSAIVSSDVAGCIAGYDMVLNITRGHSAFVAWALLSKYMLQGQIYLERMRAAQPHLNAEELGAFLILTPSLPEQRAIAAFLDRETGRIDRLVAKKRELIERLKEKRTALISRTVTRGLPAAAAAKAGLPLNPPLKPSGVDWIGEIPGHWEATQVKFIARIGNGSTPNRDNPGYWEDGDYPWLNSSVVNQEAITEAEEFVTALALRECHLPKVEPPAVLIGITGQGRTRGMASTLMFEATINQHIAYLKPYSRHADVGFLRRVFDMAYLFLRSESDGGGSTKGAITCEQIANLKIPLPPLPEQIAIAAYLDAETVKIDALVTKVEEAIERLQEYRTALITAAVTGKVDVREVPK